MKKGLKFIIFIFLFGVIWKNVFSVLWLPKNGISQFYEEPKNGLDVIYIGTSNVYVHFNPVLAYHNFGITTGVLSNGNQQPAAFKYLLEEAQKYQKPKVYLIDISYAFVYQKDASFIRRVTDALKPSVNRMKAVKNLLKYSEVPKNEQFNYYFSFFTYHNNWKNISKNSYRPEVMFKGHLLSDETIGIVAQKDHKWISQKASIPESIEEIFTDLISYIKEKNLNVVFVLAPKVYSNESMAILNSIVEKIEKNDLPVWNLKYLENLNIDYSHDLYNDLHLNVWGATKFTNVFSKYLKDKYDLMDHRNDKRFLSWHDEYERYKDLFKRLTGDDFENINKI